MHILTERIMFGSNETQILVMAWMMKEPFLITMWHVWVLADTFNQFYMVRRGPCATAWLTKAHEILERDYNAWRSMNPDEINLWPGISWWSANTKH